MPTNTTIAKAQSAHIRALKIKSFIPSTQDAKAVIGPVEGKLTREDWDRYARAIGCQARISGGTGGVPLFVIR